MNKRVVVCGVDTSKIPKLKPKELANLLLEAKNGNREAREKFIYHNYRLVLSITHRFSAKNANVDDLFQVGVIGLIKAINNFDISLNLKFSTYAVPMICGEIKRYLRDNSFLRVSRSLKDLAYQLLKTKESYQKKFGQDPTPETIAKILNIPLKLVFIALDSASEPLSLFDKVYDGGGNSLLLVDEIKDPSESFEKQIERLALKSAISKLEDREKVILNKRYFEGKTQIEVSREIGISQAQVSRLEKNALKSLQVNL